MLNSIRDGRIAYLAKKAYFCKIITNFATFFA